MQYLSGVWESLTGHNNAKRKRSSDGAEALPERMTSLKLFTDQCPGRQQSSDTISRLLQTSLLEDSSSAAAESHFCVPSDCHTSDQSSLLLKNDFKAPSKQPQSQLQQKQQSNHGGSASGLARSAAQSAPVLPAFTGYRQRRHTLPNKPSPSHFTSAHSQHPSAAETSAAGAAAGLCNSKSAFTSVSRQTELHRQHHAHHQHDVPTASTGLLCSESLSPSTYRAPPNPEPFDDSMLPSPELDLTESVADSPDDNDLLDDILSSPSEPGPDIALAFLALCQCPQITTALSKLQACHQLPCPTTLSALPQEVQQCPAALSTELRTASLMVQKWSKASQLEWTVAGMFALCLRADFDILDLDPTMMLSLLWILECCSSQYNSNLMVVTSNYLAYTSVAAATAGPRTPAEVRSWQQDMKTSQLEILNRCSWRVHMDLEADLMPALQRLQQKDALPMLNSVLRHTEAESRHRRYMDAQLAAHRQKHASQAQHAQQAQQAQHARHSQLSNAQQVQQMTCCKSSTKPQKHRAATHYSQHSQHARLRHEAEDLHHSSLDGKYWQADSSNGHGTDAPAQHETLVSLGHRVRNRAVRTRLMYKDGTSAGIPNR